ncbi:MAG: helix-turn-helix domain-containing protein [Fusobacterium sp.]|nr:helix-turn-helix domain-containing protein [Fusobacterium sp.]
MQYHERNNAIILGNRVKELRMKCSPSLNAFVMERGGLTTASWSRLENGKFDAKFSSLVKAAAMLNISLCELVSGLELDYSLED